MIFFPLSNYFEEKTHTNIQKKLLFHQSPKLQLYDIKNLKLNGATILDLSKKHKPETLIVVVKKINDGLLQIYLFMYDICPTHKKKKKKNMKRNFSNS